MAKSNNIVHQYFKKQFDGHKVLVKVNPIQYKGTELTISGTNTVTSRDIEFDEQIEQDLRVDGFESCSALEFNIYASGLAT
jgi:hypothetical protein